MNLLSFLEKELSDLEASFLLRIKKISAMKGTELASLIADMNFLQELQDLGLTKILDKLETEYAQIINDAKANSNIKVSILTINELNAIKDLDVGVLLGHAENYANTFKSRFLKGLIAGESPRKLADSIDIGLTSSQNLAVINTAKSEFNSIALAKLYEDTPEQKFFLDGVLDNRTRCQCGAVLTYQDKEGYTKQAIDDGAFTDIARQHCPKFKGEYTWTFRGGFNCRHTIKPKLQ